MAVLRLRKRFAHPLMTNFKAVNRQPAANYWRCSLIFSVVVALDLLVHIQQ